MTVNQRHVSQPLESQPYPWLRQRLSAPFWWLITLGGSGDGHARGALRVWVWWERLYLWRHHVRALSDTSIFRIEVRTHRGDTVVLPGDRTVARGDLVVELHLANRRVAGASDTAGWSPFQVIAAVRADLSLLSRLVTAGLLGPVTAVHAISLLAPALERVGFRVAPLPPSPWSRLVRFYLIGLLAVYHPRGWAGAMRARSRAWPAEAWMSSESLPLAIATFAHG